MDYTFSSRPASNTASVAANVKMLGQVLWVTADLQDSGMFGPSPDSALLQVEIQEECKAEMCQLLIK